MNYFYIYDSNGNGSLSDEVPQVMVNTSGSIWEMASLSVTSGRIFTFATLSSSNNIPTDISISSTSTNENVASGSLIGTFTTTDLDITDTHTYSFVAGT
ncbi:MAG: hypothetical protein H6767_03985 [Candidatus Peribacteria bacterium]|nr:MAG: hypothetical protein H6767_03985 [Candidatus Peribacteria bacterium]